MTPPVTPPQPLYTFIEFDCPAKYKPIKDQVWALFRKNSHAMDLLNDLKRLFSGRVAGKYTTKIFVDFFKDVMPPGPGEGGEMYACDAKRNRLGDGIVRGSRYYRVIIYQQEQVVIADEAGHFIGDNYWPCAPTKDDPCPCAIKFKYTDLAAQEATLLYHELLHIWYIHKGKLHNVKDPIDYRTGHASQAKCEIASDFLEKMESFINTVDTISQ